MAPPDEVTEDFQLWSKTTTQSATTLSKTSKTSAHCCDQTTSEISSLLLSNLPNLLHPIRTKAPPVMHTHKLSSTCTLYLFVHATSPTTTSSFHIKLAMDATMTMTIETPSKKFTDDLPYQHLLASAGEITPVTGTIVLRPAEFETTTVILTVSSTISVSNTAAAFSTGTLSTTSALSATEQAASALDHLSALVPSLHHRFARYSVVDELMYAKFEATLADLPPLTRLEADQIDDSLQYDSNLQQSKWSRVPGTVRSSVHYFQKIESDARAWGKAVATVDAPAATVLSYIYCLDSYENMNIFLKREGSSSRRKVLRVPSSRSLLTLFERKLGLGLTPRIFAMWFTYDRLPDGSYLMAFADLKEYKEFNSATVTANNLLQDTKKMVRGSAKGEIHKARRGGRARETERSEQCGQGT